MKDSVWFYLATALGPIVIPFYLGMVCDICYTWFRRGWKVFK